MVFADTPSLEGLLADDFTLTHMTGYVQRKTAWLGDIDSGQMQYHSIDDVELLVDPSLKFLTVRTMTDATIWGSRGRWRLQLRIFFDDAGDHLVAARTVAFTW